MEFGPLGEQLMTVKNAAIMIGCGVAMEAFKRGPLTSKFAATKWGKVGAYYAPFLWAWILLFVPLGLAPENSGIGFKAMLGLILGGATSKIYSIFKGTVKNALKKTRRRDDARGAKEVIRRVLRFLGVVLGVEQFKRWWRNHFA